MLKCKKTDVKRKFNCVSTTKSIWIKVFDASDYVMQQYLTLCNNKMAEKYIDISYISSISVDLGNYLAWSMVLIPSLQNVVRLKKLKLVLLKLMVVFMKDE